MKRCPTCNKTYTDRNLSFCIDDGTPLVNDPIVSSPPPGENRGSSADQQPYKPRDWQAPDYQPPGFYVPPGTAEKRRSWPWVVGIMAVLLIGIAGLGVAAAIMIPKMMRASNRNSPAVNANAERGPGNANANTNTNGSNSNLGNLNENANSNSADEVAAPPPTDSAEVLASLTDLEHEWTVANINADKKKLSRILADDYVGTTSDGKSQGKAEYLRTIERDTATQKWDFEDLKVDLKGDRATLTGVVRFQTADREAAFRFTDKFVWRDGRWQATGSEVTQME